MILHTIDLITHGNVHHYETKSQIKEGWSINERDPKENDTEDIPF